MSTHLNNDLERLHRDILQMCSIVEGMIHRAVDGLTEPARGLSAELAQTDSQIDRLDVQIEDECLKILTLHQPVATDLRRIATVMKVTGELERVADLGVNIAERAEGLFASAHILVPQQMHDMSRLAMEMLHRSIDSYVQLDSQHARQIIAEDDLVDQLNSQMILDLHSTMKSSPDLVEPALHLFSATRHIERVADHATNIAEDVVYLVEGEIIRHQLNTTPAAADAAAQGTEPESVHTLHADEINGRT